MTLLAGLGERDFAGFIDGLVERLDAAEGDLDLEQDDTDLEPDDDAKGDTSWTEWHTRGGHKLDRRASESRDPIPGTTPYAQVGEDDEDDDPAEAAGDEHDTGNAEDEELTDSAVRYAIEGPGCAISDPADRDESDGGHCMTFGVDQSRMFRPGLRPVCRAVTNQATGAPAIC